MQWYEWVFDGVGGTAIAGILGVVLRKLFTKSEPITQVVEGSSVSTSVHAPIINSQVLTGSNITTVMHNHPHPQAPSYKLTEPSPDQIMEDLSNLSPYDRSLSLEKYRGSPVLWYLELCNIHKYPDDCHVTFRSSLNPSTFAIVSIEFSVLPQEIMLAPKDSKVWVRGWIKSVDQRIISLEKDAEIVGVKRPQDIHRMRQIDAV